MNANVFMTMADGQVISGNQQSYSLLDMFRHVDAALASLNAEQIGALKAMYNKFAQTMSSWNLENLMAWTGEEETV